MTRRCRCCISVEGRVVQRVTGMSPAGCMHTNATSCWLHQLLRPGPCIAGFTGTPPPEMEPVPMLDPSECDEGTTPNPRGGCSPCGGFAQLVCVGAPSSRFYY